MGYSWSSYFFNGFLYRMFLLMKQCIISILLVTALHNTHHWELNVLMRSFEKIVTVICVVLLLYSEKSSSHNRLWCHCRCRRLTCTSITRYLNIKLYGKGFLESCILLTVPKNRAKRPSFFREMIME